MQTFFLNAPFIFQLKQGLCVQGTSGGNAEGFPFADDVVVFRGESFEELDGAVLKLGFPVLAAVGEEERDDGVDEEGVAGGFTNRSGFFVFGWGVEAVMGGPVVAGLGLEKGVQGFEVVDFQNLGEQMGRLVDQAAELGDAEGGEVGGAQPHEFPGMAFDGGELVFVLQELVFPLQLLGIGILEGLGQ